MNYIKFCSILFTVALLTTASSTLNKHDFLGKVYSIDKECTDKKIINEKTITTQDTKIDTELTNQNEFIKKSIPTDKPLSEEDLQVLFPDANFRNVITRNFKNQEITLDKISKLSGEFYATGENIENLEGISYLNSIDTFVFWNNDIKELPREILTLNNIKSINLANNYITDDTIVNKLIDKNINVNYDLNFIKNKSNQYKLSTYYKTLDLNVGEELSLDKLLYKDVKEYDNYWEVSNEISKNIKYMVSIDDDKIINLKEQSKVEAISAGNCTVKISLDDNFYNKSTTSVSIKVKN